MAITFDAANGNKVPSGTSNTWSHTVTAAHANLILIVAIDTGGTVTSMTYGGQSMTALAGASIVQSGGETLALWYLLAPPTGTNNVVVNLGSTIYSIGVSASYYNVAQTSTFGTPASATGTSISSSNTVTTTSSNQLVIDVVNNQAANTDTATASQTFRFQPASSGAAESDIAATGANMTLSWSFGGLTQTWGQVSVAMNPVAAGGATHLRISDGYGGVFS